MRSEETGRVMHLHCRTAGQRGGVTLAAKRHSCGGWIFGIAICETSDMYGKRRGREIARGRMERQRVGTRIVDLAGRVDTEDRVGMWNLVISHAKMAVLYAARTGSKQPLCEALSRAWVRVSAARQKKEVKA